MTTRKKRVSKKPFTCPFCHSALQATVTLDCDVDANTGIVISNHHVGDYRIYCVNDCPEWKECGPDSISHNGWPMPADVTSFIELTTDTIRIGEGK